MITRVVISLEATCEDGTVLRIPVSVHPSSVDVEDARLLFQVDHTIADREIASGGLGDVVYDEELLRILMGKARKAWEGMAGTWPDGKDPEDLLDRMTLLLASQLRVRGGPPPT